MKIHLELKRYFGIETLLSPDTAEEIWQKCNEMLKREEFCVRGLIERSNVKVVCTTDDPIDSLEYHLALAKDSTFEVKILPTFRPDNAINIDREGFAFYLCKLGIAAGIEIKTLKDLKKALEQRIEFFNQVGCRLSDHSLEPIVYTNGTEEEAADIFKKGLTGSTLTKTEIQKYKTQVLLFLGREYWRRNWVMQLHIGAIRNNTKRMMKLLGTDAGFDAIGDYVFAEELANTLNALDETDELPRMIVYCLNSRDNEVIATILGCFQGGGIPGKMQFGSGWWFNDQKDGMIRQMTALANIGLLSKFVGMLTDSRNFLSYTRHEYFRRILCNLLGEWVENGEMPGDMKLLGNMVKDICFNNAKDYFGIV